MLLIRRETMLNSLYPCLVKTKILKNQAVIFREGSAGINSFIYRHSQKSEGTKVRSVTEVY